MIVSIICLSTLLINGNSINYLCEQQKLSSIAVGLLSQECGPDIGHCSREQCCSSSGFCGFSTPEHCGIGCQPEYGRCFRRLPSKITKSGQKCRESGLSCPRGECCSKYERCGVTDEHCGSGCLEAFGSCTLRKGQNISFIVG